MDREGREEFRQNHEDYREKYEQHRAARDAVVKESGYFADLIFGMRSPRSLRLGCIRDLMKWWTKKTMREGLCRRFWII